MKNSIEVCLLLGQKKHLSIVFICKLKIGWLQTSMVFYMARFLLNISMRMKTRKYNERKLFTETKNKIHVNILSLIIQNIHGRKWHQTWSEYSFSRRDGGIYWKRTFAMENCHFRDNNSPKNRNRITNKVCIFSNALYQKIF